MRRVTFTSASVWERARPAAREDMALAALLGGLALANALRPFTASLRRSVECFLPHGAVCAALLPHVIAVNILGPSSDRQV
jgi:alcohol dehydrogenase class IV